MNLYLFFVFVKLVSLTIFRELIFLQKALFFIKNKTKEMEKKYIFYAQGKGCVLLKINRMKISYLI